MFGLRQFLLACALALLFTRGVSSQEQGARRGVVGVRAGLVLAPCEVPGAGEGVQEKARCGTFEVFENRATKKGRKVSIKIVVFPATGQNTAPDPLFYIAGGPGSSATEDAPYIAQQYAKIRERRDLVFVDQRGTGGSNPLNCDLFNPQDLQSYLGDYFPLEDVRRCRGQLEPKADLKLYTTHIAMDDLDDVRAALGYERINIVGASYGTRAAQAYLRQHGEHVRAVVLHGVSLTGQFMPRDFPQDTERALDGVMNECAADEACRAAFPDLRAEAKAVLDKLTRGPVEVNLKNAQTGENIPLKLSRDLAGEAIRYMLYQPDAASRIPLYIHLAARGDFAPLAKSAILYRRQIVATGSNGMYLSVTCAEDLPWIKQGVGKRNGERTFLGDYRLRQQRAACALWPRGEIPKGYSEPTRSGVPALILTGQWDPVTPPVYGDTAARFLTNSLHVVVPHGGHGFGGLSGLDCIENLVADFVERGTTKGLDTSCVKSIRRRGFQLELPNQRPS
ncbi:MAG TPA: alpha/beta fold hydrolase [Pyrinomonadaceae bacterium]|jgi:pimeloyl-ACP methyl ester carboxylesterase|nr:alpha/beta fold hydrolase [Pyrinomonadaceae bacterium]